MSPSSWRLLGIGLVIFGAAEYFGIIQLFSGTTSGGTACIGANLFGLCVGVLEKVSTTVVNGSNADLGGLSAVVGVVAYVSHRSGT